MFFIASKAEEPKPAAPEPAAPEPEPVEEEGEEVVDPKDAIEEACAKSAECLPVKTRFDQCQERVFAAEAELAEGEELDDPETCVEEFFDLMHCIHTCVSFDDENTFDEIWFLTALFYAESRLQRNYSINSNKNILN